MKNNRGQTIIERIREDIDYAKNIGDAEHKKVLAYKVLGAADLAVEFGLIMYEEWEQFISEIFRMTEGECP